MEGFPANIAIFTFLVTLTPEAAPEGRPALGCVQGVDTDLPHKLGAPRFVDRVRCCCFAVAVDSPTRRIPIREVMGRDKKVSYRRPHVPWMMVP